MMRSMLLLPFAAFAFAQEPSPSSPRRALPPPFPSPPFPSGDYQGFPLVGVPPSDARWPLETALGQPSRLRFYGWSTVSANLSSARDSNMPTSYWIVPDSVQLEQTVLRLEREVDSAQQDHVDWGFRSTLLYGTDYRYMTAGGWNSEQLLEDNALYGYDFTEQYVDLYVPRIADGLVLRAGRWVACPDIETQFAPDNYMGTHSLLFTVDTYTQTGVMATLMLDRNWTLQAGLHAGTDMAPWYEGAVPTGMFGVRWVADDNDDSCYVVLNAINDARFQRFEQNGQASGHDNFNYLVGTWQHRCSQDVHWKLESYVMWQRDAVVGGTPSLGPVRSFGGGGGLGADIPGLTLTYGALHNLLLRVGDADFVTVRNEVVRDEDGARYGVAGTYSSHAIGLSHAFSPLVQIRPELGWYRNWDAPVFDRGRDRDLWLLGFDLTVRF